MLGKSAEQACLCVALYLKLKGINYKRISSGLFFFFSRQERGLGRCEMIKRTRDERKMVVISLLLLYLSLCLRFPITVNSVCCILPGTVQMWVMNWCWSTQVCVLQLVLKCMGGMNRINCGWWFGLELLRCWSWIGPELFWFGSAILNGTVMGQ